MLAEWSVECSADDPVLVVPWKDPDGRSAFVDLRANPYDFDAIPEAVHYPPLMQALRALNASRSPVFTAKCDAWTLDEEELKHLQLNLDLENVEAATGFASYIDVVCRDRSLFTSFHQHEQILSRVGRLADPLYHPAAELECVLRPAFIDLEGPQEGYALSVYVKALGPDQPTASEQWSNALEAVVALVRGKDFIR